MKQSWIPAEWANSGTNTSTHHKLSPFHNKQFTSTGLSMDAKNGGQYHANFPTRYIDTQTQNIKRKYNPLLDT